MKRVLVLAPTAVQVDGNCCGKHCAHRWSYLASEPHHERCGLFNLRCVQRQDNHRERLDPPGFEGFLAPSKISNRNLTPT